VEIAGIQKALDDIRGEALVFHGFTDYMRDYDLIVFPESSLMSDPETDPTLHRELTAIAKEHGSYILANVIDEVTEPGKAFNANRLYDPQGRLVGTYAKRHLVPFGERMPFQWLVPALGHVDFGQAEWRPGTDDVLFAGGTGRFGCLICFEAIFPDLARRDVNNGATWLVNVTNDEWFGNSAALYQHAAMAVFRAVENHVPLARSANTGLTLVTDAYGRIVAQAPVWRPEILVARLASPGPRTPYTRFGDWPGIACIAGALALVAFAFGRR